MHVVNINNTLRNQASFTNNIFLVLKPQFIKTENYYQSNNTFTYTNRIFRTFFTLCLVRSTPAIS